MAATLGRDEHGNLIRKAGIMAIVLTGGEIRPDDPIRAWSYPRATPSARPDPTPTRAPDQADAQVAELLRTGCVRARASAADHTDVVALELGIRVTTGMPSTIAWALLPDRPVGAGAVADAPPRGRGQE